MVSDLWREEKTLRSVKRGWEKENEMIMRTFLKPSLPPPPLSSSHCKTPGQFIDNDDRYMPD